ncbi:MAG: hypothetical protein AB8H47_07455 [Bacteroidia bacterium]
MKTLYAAFLTLLLWSCSPAFTEGDKKEIADSSYSPLQECLLNQLSTEEIAYPAFWEQASGSKASFYQFDQNADNLYFSLPFDELSDRSNLSKICLDTSAITFGDHLDEYISLDGLVLSDSLGMIFRFPANLLTADTTRRLSAGDYSLTLAEMVRWNQNKYVYNGPVLFALDPINSVALPNLSPTIAMPGTPSIKRLVHKLTAKTKKQEEKAQQLLDFVSQQIEYKSYGPYQVFIRPHEILLAQKGDDRGKLSLYASLLGEAKIPYLIVYLEIGPTIAVAGDFVNGNRLNFLHEGQEYTLAAPTIKDFVLGETKMMEAYKWSHAHYVQYPGKETRLFDLANQDSIGFMSVEVSLGSE